MSTNDILKVAEPGIVYTTDSMLRLLLDKGYRPGSRQNVQSALAKLCRKGKLHRVSAGHYELNSV